MAVLITTDEEEALLELGDETATVGRARDSSLCLRASKISLKHAKIEPSDEGYVLIDLNSTNGTYVNGSRIDRKLLEDGDRIRFGPYELFFVAEEDESATIIAEPEVMDEDEEPEAEEEYDEKEYEEEEEDEEEEEEEEEDEFDEVEELDEDEYEAELEEEYDREVHFRRRLRQGSRRRRVRSAILFSIFLLLSIVAHYQGRHIFNLIGMNTRSVEWTPIEIEMDFVMIIEEDAVPEQKHDVLEILPEEMLLPPDEQAAQELPKVIEDVPPMKLGDLSVIDGIQIAGFVPVQEFRPEQSFTAADSTGALALTTSEQARTFSDQLDDFAMEMINTLVEEPLHVVLIFDRSYSLEDDRAYMQKRLERIIELLGFNLKPTEMARLKWSVVGFGDMTRIYLNKADDLDKVKQGIRKISNDPSGVENLLSAISYCIRTLDQSRGRTFFVIVTDEAGDDTKDDEKVVITLRSLLKHDVAVYVFGRDANFSTPVIQGFGIDPATGQKIQGDVMAGPESAFSEFFAVDELFHRIAVLPSGFGLYVQSRLCGATGGRYYMLGGQASKYDPDALADRAPELCSRSEYQKRTRKSKLRKIIADVLAEWPGICPKPGVRNQAIKEEIKRHIEAGRKAEAFCAKAIEELEKALKSVDREKHQPERWKANGDLVLAQLYRFRFLLSDYILKLRNFGNNTPMTKDGSPMIGFRIVRPPRPGRPDKELLEKAKLAETYLAKVIEKHPKTPWEDMARMLRIDRGLFQVIPMYRPKRRPEDDGEPRPPKPPEPPKKRPPKL